MKHLYLLCLCCFFQSNFAQYDTVLDLFYQRKMDNAKTLIQTQFDGEDQALLNAKLALENKNLADAFQILFEVDTLALSPYQKGFYYEFLARTYDNNAEQDEALKAFHTAQKYFKKEGLIEHYNQINLEIYYLYLSQEPFEQYAPDVLNEFFDLAKTYNNQRQLVEANIERAFTDLEKQNMEAFEESFANGFTIAEKNNDSIGIAKLHSYKGLIYSEYLGNYEEAEFHYDKAIEIYDAIDENYKKKPILLNKSLMYEYQNNTEKCIAYLLEAEKQPTTENDNGVSVFIYEKLASNYEQIGEIDSALVYTKKLIALNEKINENQQFINITRFEAEKKENQNTLLRQKNELNRSLLFFLGVVLLALILVIYLIYTNAKRKQLLLSKKRELAEQRNQSLLKEQELKSIDAMLEGQEKERQRMASDLHDNIGASLTSVKMHFNQIKQQIKNKEYDELIFQKTDALLEDTYQEIRNLAHLKNAGVLAKDGLVPALKNLVEKSSNQTNFKIELSVHDLESRLKNSLEIGIFRIVQELIANIMKHAKASNVSISITHHGEFINLIVEDDGIGFDAKNHSQKGMGLQSIKKKIEHLNGEMDIDSHEGVGTTVIIDLPL